RIIELKTMRSGWYFAGDGLAVQESREPFAIELHDNLPLLHIGRRSALNRDARFHYRVLGTAASTTDFSGSIRNVQVNVPTTITPVVTKKGVTQEVKNPKTSGTSDAPSAPA